MCKIYQASVIFSSIFDLDRISWTISLWKRLGPHARAWGSVGLVHNKRGLKVSIVFPYFIAIFVVSYGIFNIVVLEIPYHATKTAICQFHWIYKNGLWKFIVSVVHWIRGLHWYQPGVCTCLRRFLLSHDICKSKSKSKSKKILFIVGTL